MVKFLFSVHTITEAIGRAEPGRWILDLARPGVAPPLLDTGLIGHFGATSLRRQSVTTTTQQPAKTIPNDGSSV